MSWQAIAWAIQQTTGSARRKLLLLALANYADKNGVCWPSQETLARDTEQSVDTVQRQLDVLERQKRVQRERMPKRRGQWQGHRYNCPCKPMRRRRGSMRLGLLICGLATPQFQLCPGRRACGLNLQ